MNKAGTQEDVHLSLQDMYEGCVISALMDKRRITGGGIILVVGGILARETFFLLWEGFIKLLGRGASEVAWSELPWVNIAGIAAMIGAMVYMFWPRIRAAFIPREVAPTLSRAELLALIDEHAPAPTLTEARVLELIGEKSPPQAPEKPDVRMQITGGKASIPTAAPDRVQLLLELRVWNLGKPVHIVKWALTICLDGEGRHAAPLSLVPPMLVIDGQELSDLKDLSALLVDELLSSEIINGDLLFYTKLDIKKVTAASTIWELRAEDAFGTDFKTRLRVGSLLRLNDG